MDLAERLIVAADFDPRKAGAVALVKEQAMELAKKLEGTGVYLKINSVLRACGYDLILDLHDLGLKVFADLKLIDIPKTMEFDGGFLSFAQPEIVTMMCCAGIDGMNALKQAVGDQTEVLGVTVLTSLNEEECQSIFTCSTKAGVLRFARMAQLAGADGLICSPHEAELLKNRRELLLEGNCPGIRPEWTLVQGDDQARVMTPAKAIQNGAKRLVIGRPITGADDPKDAVKRTLEEIQRALEE